MSFMVIEVADVNWLNLRMKSYPKYESIRYYIKFIKILWAIYKFQKLVIIFYYVCCLVDFGLWCHSGAYCHLSHFFIIITVATQMKSCHYLSCQSSTLCNEVHQPRSQGLPPSEICKISIHLNFLSGKNLSFPKFPSLLLPTRSSYTENCWELPCIDFRVVYWYLDIFQICHKKLGADKLHPSIFYPSRKLAKFFGENPEYLWLVINQF